MEQCFKPTQCTGTVEQQLTAGLHQRKLRQRNFFTLSNLELGFAVKKANPRTRKTNLRACKQVYSLIGRHAEKRFGSILRLGEIDVEVGCIFHNQNAFLSGDLQHGFPTFLTERKPAGIMPIWHRVIERHKKTLLSRGANLRAHAIWQRSFTVHLDAKDGRMLAQCYARGEPCVCWRVSDICDGLTGMLEHGTNKIYPTGSTHRGNQLFSIKGQIPVSAVDIGKGLSRRYWP